MYKIQTSLPYAYLTSGDCLWRLLYLQIISFKGFVA